MPAPISTTSSTRAAFNNSTVSRQRTMRRDLLDEQLADHIGVAGRRAVTLATTGTTRAARAASPRALRPSTSAAGAISVQWKGALTGSMIARRAPRSAASATARSTASRIAADDDLAGAVVIGDDADLARRLRPRRPGARGLDIEAEQRRHRALAHRHRLLHRLAAPLDEPHRIGDREGAAPPPCAEYSPSECPAT